VGQSIPLAHQVTAAQAAGVRSVQVWPPSVDSATAGVSDRLTPAAQQTGVVGHETPWTWKLVLTTEPGAHAWPPSPDTSEAGGIGALSILHRHVAICGD
jgi:hypothetical protein